MHEISIVIVDICCLIYNYYELYITFVKLFAVGAAVRVELVMRRVGTSRLAVAARLMQLRDQLEPNGDVVASVMAF